MEAETVERTPSDRQRAVVRFASMAVALVLTVTAVVVLTRHQPPARSTQAFCTQMARATDLGTALTSGDADQIVAAVHRFDRAVPVAPRTVQASVTTVAAYADGLARAVAQGSNPAAELRAAMARQQGQVAAVNAAGRDLDQFVATNCRVDLMPAASSTVPGGLTPTSAPG